MANYIYTSSRVPTEADSTPGSPICYNEDPSPVEHTPVMTSTISSKKDLVNLIIFIFYQSLDSQYSLNLSDDQIHSFSTLVNLLIIKSNASLSIVAKNFILLEKTLCANSASSLSFSSLKRYILAVFALTSSSNVPLSTWSAITGVPQNILQHDTCAITTALAEGNTIANSVSDLEVAQFNSMLQMQVRKYALVA